MAATTKLEWKKEIHERKTSLGARENEEMFKMKQETALFDGRKKQKNHNEFRLEYDAYAQLPSWTKRRTKKKTRIFSA